MVTNHAKEKLNKESFLDTSAHDLQNSGLKTARVPLVTHQGSIQSPSYLNKKYEAFEEKSPRENFRYLNLAKLDIGDSQIPIKEEEEKVSRFQENSN